MVEGSGWRRDGRKVAYILSAEHLWHLKSVGLHLAQCVYFKGDCKIGNDISRSAYVQVQIKHYVFYEMPEQYICDFLIFLKNQSKKPILSHFKQPYNTVTQIKWPKFS